ncbi:MAG: transcriptional regulator [Desulfobacterium sp.]|nr:transcriptional regulator [Desulfobacterium sp.]
MKRASGNRVCSVARTLEILGDRWIFLILREAFFGVRNYDQFLSNLGIATNILSSRLKTLVAHGIMEKQQDRKDARRIRYRLTEKGLDLYTIVLAFMQWGDRWLADADGPPLELYHKGCGRRLEPVMNCAACGKTVHAHEVGYVEKKPFQTPKKSTT